MARVAAREVAEARVAARDVAKAREATVEVKVKGQAAVRAPRPVTAMAVRHRWHQY